MTTEACARTESKAEGSRETVSPSRRDAIGDWLDVFLSAARLPKRDAQAVRDELEDHLRSRVDDLMIAGKTEPEAVQQAVAELGETVELARRFRSARVTPLRRSIMHGMLFAGAGAAVMAAVGLLTPTIPMGATQPAGTVAVTGADAGLRSQASEPAGLTFPADIDRDTLSGVFEHLAAETNHKLYVAWSVIDEWSGVAPDDTLESLPLGGSRWKWALI